MNKHWKYLAIAAIAAEYITLGCALVIRDKAHKQMVMATEAMKKANTAVGLMSTCSNRCVEVLANDDLEPAQKLERMLEEFEFVSVVIEATYEEGEEA